MCDTFLFFNGGGGGMGGGPGRAFFKELPSGRLEASVVKSFHACCSSAWDGSAISG